MISYFVLNQLFDIVGLSYEPKYVVSLESYLSVGLVECAVGSFDTHNQAAIFVADTQ